MPGPVSKGKSYQRAHLVTAELGMDELGSTFTRWTAHGVGASAALQSARRRGSSGNAAKGKGRRVLD
jgi:hypothetical protein